MLPLTLVAGIVGAWAERLKPRTKAIIIRIEIDLFTIILLVATLFDFESNHPI